MSCNRTVLVEPCFDDRLGRAGKASLEGHLPACEECTERLRELEALREDVRELALMDDVTPLAHQRARLALLRKAAEPTRAPRRTRAMWIGIALVFAPAAVFAARATYHALPASEAPAVVPTTSAASATSTPKTRAADAPTPRASEDAPEALARDATLTPTRGPNDAIAPEMRGPAPESHGPDHALAPAHGLPRKPLTPESHGPNKALASQPVASSRAPASRDFADAMDSVSHGDFGAGAAKLDRFAREYPQDPRAEEALYLEAIALERAGRRDEARMVARRYLSAYPHGAHSANTQRLSE
jgi:TolA-binding protein